ncbi:MAG TPA: hypothetical protein VLT45_21595 [Kofleriaceae bacterium]|nr:hypothetical protein [Kofleriaceae bacterium]
MTLDEWRNSSEADQRAFAEDIAKKLGGELVEFVGEDQLAVIAHPEGPELVLIPGGTFERGVRPDELEMMRAREWSEPEPSGGERSEDALAWLDEIAKAGTETVTVAPFLLARAPLLARDVDGGWVVGDEESDESAVRLDQDMASVLLRDSPFRVPTSIEWEWVAREGGELPFVDGADAEDAEAACEDVYDSSYDADLANGWGVWGLPWGDWVGEGKEPRAGRGGAAMTYPWQADELILQLAGLPDDAAGNAEHCLRFALDLPR